MMGYLGGIGWTILATKVYLVSYKIIRFFQIINQYKY